MIHLTSIDMRKYTANYTVTNPNFTIQNLVETEVDFAEKPLLFVLKNILDKLGPNPAGKNIFAAAFGPGLTVETMQLCHV